MNSTVTFYDENADEYCNNTVSADMSHLYSKFLKHIKHGGKILDAGCGSGRDSLYFKNCGYNVTAFDSSKEMVKRSTTLVNQNVIQMTFEEFTIKDSFDGIWSCASLLHVKRINLVLVIQKLTKVLKHNGIFYMSFKFGNKEYEKDGRYFNSYDEDSFNDLIKVIPELKIDELFKTTDVRPGRTNEYWLNCLLRKE